MHTGLAHLPLHHGRAPAWLFQRMKLMAREIILWLAGDFGPEEILRRVSDPFWFQALGCVLGFDWHSSGVTTTVCGALKEGIKGLENELGLFVAGGKGKTSRQTPMEIQQVGGCISVDPQKLVYASRMAAKVDGNALQDGYQIYHHTFMFTKRGNWCVVQQGMNEKTRYARRYHWLSQQVQDFVCEPHAAICSQARGRALNLVAVESAQARATITLLSHEPPHRLVGELMRIKTIHLPEHHQVLAQDIHPERLGSILLKTYQRRPEDFERLLGMSGVGSRTIRALSLIAELVHGVSPCFSDPARFSFAHGGKDGHPYPVDREEYDRSIDILKSAISRAKVGNRERLDAIKRLRSFYGKEL